MKFFFWKWTLMVLGLVWGCGLPSSTAVNINNLNKPELNIYNQGDTLYLEIKGYYPTEEYPDFVGYNIYVGDNNNVDKVVDRILYISDRDDLPSYEVPTSLSTSKVTVSLKEILFRYSKYFNNESVSGEVDRNALFSKPLLNYERYYFVVEAVEETRTGIRTEAVKVIFIKYSLNRKWNFNQVLGDADAFVDMNLNGNSFILPQDNNYTYGLSSVGSASSVYQTIPEDDLAYSLSPFKPYLKHIYFFRARSVEGVKQYLSVWVKDIHTDGLTVDYGHSKEMIPDFEDGVSLVIN